MRLIDADALKKALAKNLTIWAFNTSYDGVLAEVIDNAPTVDIEGYEMYGKGYCKGYLQGYEKGKNERPQPDMSKVTRYHDTSIDALIDEALDELSETKHQTSDREGVQANE